jgi:hypothetical protein
METFLGLLGLVVYIVSIIGLAAGITWLVVRLTPSSKPKPAAPSEPPAS